MTDVFENVLYGLYILAFLVGAAALSVVTFGAGLMVIGAWGLPVAVGWQAALSLLCLVFVAGVLGTLANLYE